MTPAGSILAAIGLVPLFVSADRRLRAAGLALFVAGSLLLASDVASSQLHHLRTSASRRPAEAAAGAVVAIGLLIAAGWLCRRRPWLLALAAIAAAPARIPVGVGSSSSNLLLPLYGVLAAMVVATAIDLARDDAPAPALGAIGWAAAGLVGWSAISTLWAIDGHKAGIEMLFFYLPFAFLLTRIATLPMSPAGLRAAVGVQTLLAVVFSAVALWQEATRHVFWNPTVIIGDEFGRFFRVNSLFWDSSVFGRFMAVSIVLLAGICIHRGVRPWLLAAIGLFLVALYFSYSQSAELALAAGAVVLGTALWPRRLTIALGAVTAVGAVAAIGVVLHANANKLSSDRVHLWRLGERVVRAHPLIGAGIGSFARAAVAGTAHPFAVTYTQSHTTVLTELAELGPLGLALYLALLVVTIRRALRTDADRGPRLILLALFCLLITSSVFYNDFFEDPTTWIVMGLIVVVTARNAQARPESPVMAGDGPSHQGIGAAT